MERVEGTLYRADPLPTGEPEARPIRAFDAAVFQEKSRAEKFLRRLREHECWGYAADGEVAAYFWLTRGPAVVPLWRNVRLRVPQGVVYIWDCRTWEPCRRRGWYTRSLEDARRLAAPNEAWIACDDANLDSASVIRRQFEPLQPYRLRRRFFPATLRPAPPGPQPGHGPTPG